MTNSGGKPCRNFEFICDTTFSVTYLKFIFVTNKIKYGTQNVSFHHNASEAYSRKKLQVSLHPKTLNAFLHRKVLNASPRKPQE